MIRISELTYRIGARVLFNAASVTLPPTTRIGFVGKNGAGKSTLLSLLAGRLEPESGMLEIPKRWRIGEVAQEAPAGEASLIDTVLAADIERAALLAEREASTDGARLADIELRLTDIAAHAAPARAARILAGLGFTAETQRGPVGALSGGWRMRVALAAALFAAPDLLLLDEPTNYLDLEGTLWLEGFLARYPHSTLIVSHDRDLLDGMAQAILHLEGGKLTLYRGNYSSFDRQRAEKLNLAAAQRVKQEAQRRHIQAFIDRFRAKASKARQAQSRIKMLERLTPIPAAILDETIPITFPAPEAARPPLISLEAVDAGYQTAAPVLRNLALSIAEDDRIALLGANGNGKSTFAKLLAGALAPQAGRIHRAPKLRVGYFAQHQLDGLRVGETPFAHLRTLMPTSPVDRVRARLGGFGFSADKADRPVETLSGGEKTRLLLALATFDAPHLLILDEPSNHLDIDSREALIHALNDYGGAVVLVSHDRHLLEATVDRLWLVGAGRIRPWEDDLDAYRRFVLSADAGKTEAGASASKLPAASRAEGRRETAEVRARLKPMRQKIAALEREIATLTTERDALDRALADTALYQRAPLEAQARAKRRADVESALAAAEEAWLAASHAIETLEQEAP